jgi:glycosyltransferase involved in cell wall biosynthesis
MKTIAIDARFYGTEHTGLGRYTTNVLRYLPSHLQGHTLKVLLRTKYFETLNLPKNCIKIRADFPHYSLTEQIKLPQLLATENCQLLYSLHFNVPLMVQTPFIVTIHDLIKSHFDDPKTTTRTSLIFHLKRWGYEYTIRHAVKAAREIIVPTNTVKNDILSLFDADPTHIHAIAEAPDLAFRSSKAAKDADIIKNLPSHYLLFVGNPYPHKNVGVLLQALVRLPERELVIIAHQSQFLDRELSRVEESVKKRITILSNVQDNDLASIYRGADALVTPSLMEGYGLPGLEAQMVGTPVIASNIPVFREVYGKNVSYFDPHSVDDLVRVLKSSDDMSTRSLQFDRTWDEVARDIAEVINESCSHL